MLCITLKHHSWESEVEVILSVIVSFIMGVSVYSATSAELSGCIWQHQWQPMPRSRCQNSAAVWGDAAVCWLVNSRWRLSEKICNFLSFNIYRSTQLNENVTTFCFTAYCCLSRVVNEQKVRLLSEVVKPSTAVYDTVAECDLCRQKSHTCAEAVPRR